MKETYYISPMDDGGFTVQRVQDGMEDFYSYHRTREEAEASLVNAQKRNAADELYDACKMALGLIISTDLKGGSVRAVVIALNEALLNAEARR